MRKIAALSTAAVAVLALAGCAGGNDDTSSKAGQTTTATPSGPPTSGCTKGDSEELYVTQMYECPSRGTKVYEFNTTSARDSWWTAAAEFGAVKISEGSTWLEVKA